MPENAIQELAAQPDATRVSLQPGQVLYYQDHLPPGVFVVERGELASEGSAPTGTLRLPGPPAGAKALVMPHPSQLAERSAATITAATEAVALFVPRSTIVKESKTQRLLERLAGPGVGRSLRAVP